MQKLIISVFLFGLSSGRILTPCQTARELNAFGFPYDELHEWTCLVVNESRGNTSAIGGPNSNGSYDYGLFQINGGFWCEVGKTGKGCNIACEDLIDDDITDDVICAKIIFDTQGFNAWHGWTARCQSGNSPSIDHCFN